MLKCGSLQHTSALIRSARENRHVSVGPRVDVCRFASPWVQYITKLNKQHGSQRTTLSCRGIGEVGMGRWWPSSNQAWRPGKRCSHAWEEAERRRQFRHLPEGYRQSLITPCRYIQSTTPFFLSIQTDTSSAGNNPGETLQQIMSETRRGREG